VELAGLKRLFRTVQSDIQDADNRCNCLSVTLKAREQTDTKLREKNIRLDRSLQETVNARYAGYRTLH
jgi:hypothetical protein